MSVPEPRSGSAESRPPNSRPTGSRSAGPRSAPPAWWDLVLRIAGAVVGVWAGVLLAFYGAFLTPLRINGVLTPVSLILAVGGNIALIWFTYLATRHKFVALLPSLIWVVLSFAASSRTTEGDLVLVDSNWVSMVYLLAGSVTIGVVAYRMILSRH